MKRSSFIKEISDTGIFRFLILFSKIWKIGEILRAGRTKDKTKPCPILTSIFKNKKEKLFQRYWIFLLTK